MNESNHRVLLEVQELTRRFPGVLALNQVDFDVRAGEVHALVGENGAGKSTLINILAGVLQPSGGKVLLDGTPIVFHNPADTQRAGISVIFQEFNLLPHLSVAENIFINREPTKNGMIDWDGMNQRAAQALQRLEIDIDPRVPVSSLSVARQQLVEIARALAFDARVIVMDEPTAALSEREVDRLMEIVRSMAKAGVGVIYVSHKLEEVFRVADRITILRDGTHILTDAASNLDEEKVIFAMVGRALVHGNCPDRNLGPVVLSVKNLAVEDSVRNVSFELRAGEVLGLAGLMGSGANEVIEALFGLRKGRADEIVLQEKALAIDNPRNAIHSRLGYVPNDRKKAGLLPDLSVKQNISIGILERLRKLFWIDRKEEQAAAETYRGKLNVRCSSLNQRISNLSGGNQQKVMLARALAEDCKVLLLAEPTRGVDVGAKAEIYSLIDELVDSGMAVLLQSSELPEIIRLSNRVVVFSSGQARGELSGAELTQESMMALATRVQERAMKNILNKIWKSYSIGVVVLVVGIALGVLTPRFLSVDNLLNVMTNASLVAILGLGMTLAIASGNFDLSVGSTAAFAGCISFSLVPSIGVPASIGVGLLAGAVVGFINGLVITELRVPAFIATLGMLTIVRGAALIYTDGKDLYLFGQTGYKVLSGEYLFGIPTPILLAVGIALLLGFVVSQTRFGRHILAMGSNLPAAQRSGIPTSRVLWGIFSIVGATAALSGMIISSQVLTANGRLATGLELSAIAVVVLGGTALSGGQATMVGTLLGALLISMINNGLNLLNVPIFYQELTVGVLMLGALAVNMNQSFDIRSLLRRQA